MDGLNIFLFVMFLVAVVGAIVSCKWLMRKEKKEE